MSYSSGTSTVPLRRQTIAQTLDLAVADHPDREALIESSSDRRWTFRQLLREVESLALGLQGLGIGKGDRVGIWAPNCAEWIFTQFATAKLGAILVNVNPAYRTHEVGYALQQSGMKLIVSAVEYRTSNYRSMLAEVGYEHTLFIGTQQWDEVMAAGAHADPALLDEIAESLTFDEPINIQYTSGTTGHPKGATLSHHNIVNNGFFVGEGVHYTEQDRVCLPVPLYHCFGMVMGVLGAYTHGACVVLPAPTFDPELTLRAVQEEQCTSLYGVPTMFIAELAHPKLKEYNLTSLRTGIMAGSPCPVETMERVMTEMHMPDVMICYGMTETSPVSTMTSFDDDITARTQSIGEVMPHLEVKIIDERGVVVPRGVPGQFCTRGYSVMLGYWNDQEKTAEAIDAARWMHTGDLATMDDAGRLKIVGRIKDLIIRGGENVYPREIEEFLFRHPDVRDVQVIGVPDEKYGEEIMAWIVMEDGAEPLSAEAVREYATGKLTHFKIPRYVHLTDEFPITVTGKVRKVEMRQVAIEQLLPAAEAQPGSA